MKIIKRFTSETSHIVRGATSIRCHNNVHGHGYKWLVTLEGDLQSNGMILDFKDLKPIKEFIDLFDHATVFSSIENPKIIDFFRMMFPRVLVMNKNTTAECMARLVFKFTKDWLSYTTDLIKVVQVDVWETETGCGVATECDDEDILTFIHSDKN